MLLERTLSGESMRDRSGYKINNYERINMGVLDTSSRSSSSDPRLLTAMLSDRTRRPSYSSNPPPSPVAYPNLYSPAPTGPSVYPSAYPTSEPTSQQQLQQQQRMYMTSQNMSTSRSSSPESTMSVSKNPALPTCVVAPSAQGEYDGMSEGEDSNGYIPSRKQREFIPENRKDDSYWEKRRKNNEAARRSREKRRVHDMALEKRIMELSRETCTVRNELIRVKKKYGLPLDEVFVGDDPDASSARNVPSVMTSHMTSLPSTAQAAPPSQPSDIHQRYSTIQHSPVRSRNVSGPMYQSPYPGSYPGQGLPPSHYPSSSPPSPPPYLPRAEYDTELKSYSGKHDAHNPHSMKSMKDYESPMRVNDDVRPGVYSSAFPPNIAPPYPNTLPVSSRKSYWVSTTEMTSSDSNDEGEWNDPVQDQPLSLVKKRPSTENESGSEISNNSSRASYSPPSSSPMAALPHKLRHKLSQDYPSSTIPGNIDPPIYSNGLAQLSELALAHASLPMSSSDDYSLQNPGGSFKIRPRSFSNPRSLYDNKYVERRKKNNEAARKCRENRKAITKIREVKSGYLENENGKLRDELTSLHDEMKELRELLDQKKNVPGVKSDADENESAGDESMPMVVKQESDPEGESNTTSDE